MEIKSLQILLIPIQLGIILHCGSISDGRVISITTDTGGHLEDKIRIYCKVSEISSFLSLETTTTKIYCRPNAPCQSQDDRRYSFDEKASNSTWFVFLIKSATQSDETEWKCRDQSGVQSTTLKLGKRSSPRREKISIDCGDIHSTEPVYFERFDNERWITVAACKSGSCECNAEGCGFDKAASKDSILVFYLRSATLLEGTKFRCGSRNWWKHSTYTQNGHHSPITNSAGEPPFAGYFSKATGLLLFHLVL